MSEERFGATDFNEIPGEPGCERLSAHDFNDIPFGEGVEVPPPLTAKEERLLRRHDEPNGASTRVADGGSRTTLQTRTPNDYLQTDHGNARMLADWYSDRLRHVKERRQWLVWEQGRWRPDLTGHAERAVKQLALERLRSAADIDDEKARQKAVGWALNSQSDARVRSTLSSATTELELVLRPDDLDTDPWLLSCANGTLDLRTGELRSPNPGDLITLGNDIVYDAEAECPCWVQFLNEVFDGDGELVDFVHRAIGYSLTGDTREHQLFVLHGAGRNGKTTLIEIVKQLLGGFAVQTPFDTFVRSRDGRTRNDIAALHRARLAVASESGENRRLDEATVKLVTGGDTISARFLYSEYFEYKPRFKIWLVTNSRPRINGDDEALWARLRLVPFEVSFKGREDRELPAKLQAELPGILNWAVKGCLLWQACRLGTAAAVDRATAEYQAEEDIIGGFLSERCVLEGEIAPTQLREAYDDYCREIGEKPLTAQALGKQLARRAIHKNKRSKTYKGVSLAPVPGTDP